MNILRVVALSILVAMWAVGCSEATQQTEVGAVVAAHFSHEGLETGDPVPGATLRLYQGDTVAFETVLDEEGTIKIAPEPGTYDLQIESASSDPFCFWGDTVFGVAFPSPPIIVEVGFICAGQ